MLTPPCEYCKISIYDVKANNLYKEKTATFFVTVLFHMDSIFQKAQLPDAGMGSMHRVKRRLCPHLFQGKQPLLSGKNSFAPAAYALSPGPGNLLGIPSLGIVDNQYLHRFSAFLIQYVLLKALLKNKNG